MRVAIVDDEPVAREGLRLWLAHEPDVTVVGEAGSPAEAVGLVLRERPDLLFLDVQMPGGDGFDVLESIAAEHLPEVIFVTAHERHALRAFDAAALDFLLKPVGEARFRRALDRARAELARGEAREGPARLSALLDHVRGAREGGVRRIERFAVRTRDRFVIVPAREVRWISAAAFVDAGNAFFTLPTDSATWTALLRSSLVGVGAELRASSIVLWGLPVSVRGGYAFGINGPDPIPLGSLGGLYAWLGSSF